MTLIGGSLGGEDSAVTLMEGGAVQHLSFSPQRRVPSQLGNASQAAAVRWQGVHTWSIPEKYFCLLLQTSDVGAVDCISFWQPV